MTSNSNKPYIESKNIHIFISLLNEIKRLNTQNPRISDLSDENTAEFQTLLYEAMENIANNMDSSFHKIERTFNDIIIDGDMRFNIVYFCQYCIEWLITNDNTTLKQILIKNSSPDNYDNDFKTIEKW